MAERARETVELMNMCMIRDPENGRVLVMDKQQGYRGHTFPGGHLEPGEAVALNAGRLATTVLDIVHNGMDIAILDASAACHMPDVLEMPYRPAFPLCHRAFLRHPCPGRGGGAPVLDDLGGAAGRRPGRGL